MNATFVPAGMKPLSAYRLEPPAGFNPARLGSVAVHPVMAVLSVMVPGETVKAFASKLALGIVWPRAARHNNTTITPTAAPALLNVHASSISLFRIWLFGFRRFVVYDCRPLRGERAIH